MEPTIEIDRADGVVTLTINRPKRKNAGTPQTWRELREACVEIERGDDRVVVITGAGDAFCAGSDISGDDEPEEHVLASMRQVAATCRAIFDLPKPTIARVNGDAIGVGMNMALACDFVIASENARFAEIFPKRGLVMNFGGSWMLPRIVGLQKAKEICFLARMVGAGEAAELGFVNEVVAPERLDDAVAELAARLGGGPPIALGLLKRLLNRSFEVTLEQAIESEAQAQSVCAATEDVSEAMTAWRERREPVFNGR